MLRLDNTVSLQAVLSGAVTSQQPQVTVCAIDQSASGYAGLAPVRTALNSTTDVTILSAPAASILRDVDYLSIFNRDTASVTVTIKYDQSAVDTIILIVTLATLETLIYIHGAGWSIMTASGGIKTASSAGVTFTATPTSLFDVAGSGTSTIALSMDNQNANVVIAGPASGTAAPPIARALVIADIPTNFIPAHGRLTFVSATAVKFSPYNGDLIKINNVLFQIPSAGIAGVANTSVFVNGVGASNLAASTLYYVYAFSNAGTVTADFSTTTHATSSTSGNVGVEIKSGDDTRTLIGMVRTNGSSQFAHSLTQRFVVSWFNRRTLGTMNVFTANRALATTAAWSEINTEIRIEFITWAEEAVAIVLGGGAFLNTLTDQIYIALAFDGTTPEEGSFVISATLAIIAVGLGQTKDALAEGYHFATVLSFQQSGSGGGAITGTATSGKRTGMSVGIRG